MVPVTKPVAHEPPTPAETTLMVLETWLTTQASLSVRGLTETGPSPTGISASNWGLPGWVTSNTDSDEFAVFTANRNFPSAESRIGLVCEGSKFAGAGAADCALAAAGVTIRASAAIVAPISVRFVSEIIFPPASLIPALQLGQHLRRRLPVSQLSKLDSRTSIESRCIECQRPRTSQYYAREARKSGSASFQAIFHTSPSIFTKRCCKLVRDQLSIRAGNTGAHFVGLEQI